MAVESANTLPQEPISLNASPRARALRLLREWITRGTLPTGEPIPAERTLARQLDVSRQSLRWALAELERDGLVATRGERTRLVTAPPTDEATGLLSSSVLIIAPSTAMMQHKQSGWVEYVGLGAISGVRGYGSEAMVITPRRVTGDLLGELRRLRPRGVLVAEPLPPDAEKQRETIQPLLEDLRRAGVPVVVYGNNPLDQAFDRVISDHHAGAYALTGWLIAQGRRRIVNVWAATPGSYWINDRRAGYEQAMREAGLEPTPTIWVRPIWELQSPSDENFEASTKFLAGHLIAGMTGPEPIDAIMAIGDGHVFALSAACELFGRQPGRDILITGYDNYGAESPERTRQAGPVASVDKLNWKLGQEMARLLDDRINGRLPAEPQLCKVSPQLVICDGAASGSVSPVV